MFRAGDALLQVGVGMIVLTLWYVLAVVLCVAAARRAVRRWWLLSLVWRALAFAIVAPAKGEHETEATGTESGRSDARALGARRDRFCQNC